MRSNPLAPEYSFEVGSDPMMHASSNGRAPYQPYGETGYGSSADLDRRRSLVILAVDGGDVPLAVDQCARLSFHTPVLGHPNACGSDASSPNHATILGNKTRNREAHRAIGRS